jgi:hypothetical protein
MPFDVPEISLDPYLLAIQATLFALQEAGIIPDLNPLDYIIGAFDGKPKEEDTLQAAQRLQASPWWPLQALGNNLMIWVRNGVPLSTGNPVYRAQLSEWIRGTIDSLEPIVYGRLDPGTLDHAIWLSMTSQDGASAIVELNNTIDAQHKLGPLPSTTPATQPPPAVPTEVGWNVNPDGDEVIDLGNTLVFQNSLIYDRLVQIAGELSNSGNGDCCTNVTTAIAAITGQLTILAAAVAQLTNNSASIDLAPIVAALDNLAADVKAVADGARVDLQPLVDATDRLNTTLGQFEKCVCDALNGNTPGAADLERKWRALIQLNVSEGLIDGETAQIILS